MELLRTLAPSAAEPAQWTSAVPTVANGASGMMAGSSATIECLVEDALLSQVALQHIQRAADTAEQRCELAGWRLRDVDGKNRALHNDVAELRKLLHESREPDPEQVSCLQKLPHEQLMHRCHAYAACARTERVKNAELLRRLKVRIRALLLGVTRPATLASICTFCRISTYMMLRRRSWRCIWGSCNGRTCSRTVW